MVIKWPDLRSRKWEIIDIRSVGIHARIVPWKFKIIRTKTMFTVRCWDSMSVPRFQLCSNFDLALRLRPLAPKTTTWVKLNLNWKKSLSCTSGVQKKNQNFSQKFYPIPTGFNHFLLHQTPKVVLAEGLISRIICAKDSQLDKFHCKNNHQNRLINFIVDVDVHCKSIYFRFCSYLDCSVLPPTVPRIILW